MGDIDTSSRRACRMLTTAADAVSGWHGALRLVVAATVLHAAGLVWFVSVLSAAEAITGCGFVNCGDPRPVLGVALLLPTGGSLVVAAAVLTWAMSPARARAVPLGAWVPAVAASAAVFGVLLGFDGAGGTTGNAVAGLSLVVLAALAVTRRHRLAAVPLALLQAIEDMPLRVRGTLAALVAVADVVWVAAVAALTSCGFAGGRCPDPSPAPLLEREGLWLAGGWTLAAGVAVVLLTGRRREPLAWLAAVGASVLAGLVGA